MLYIIKQCRAKKACHKVKVSGHTWKKSISWSFFSQYTLLNVAVLYFLGDMGGRDLCQGFETQLLKFKRHFPSSSKPDCASASVSVTSWVSRSFQLLHQPPFLPSGK